MAAQTYNFAGIPDEKPKQSSQPTFDLSGIPDEFVGPELNASVRDRLAATRERLKNKPKPDEPVRDAVFGAGREAVRRVQSLAAPIRKTFGMAPATPPAEETTTGGKVGAGLERIGEFFTPGAAAKGMKTAAKIATEAAGTYGVAAAQGDPHPLWAAALSAVTAPIEALKYAAPTVRGWADKAMATRLGRNVPLTDVSGNRAVAESVSRAFDLGLSPKWKAIIARADAEKSAAGEALDVAKAGPDGSQPVVMRPVIDALAHLKQTAENQVNIGKNGNLIGAGPGAARTQAAPFDPRLLKKIDELTSLLEAQGPTLEARQLSNIKKNWSDFVWQGRMFEKPKLTLEARAKDASIDAMRDVLKTDAPTISELDQKYHFARQTFDVISEAAGMGPLSKTERAMATATAREIKRSTIAGLAGGAVGGAASYATGIPYGLGSLVGAVTVTALEKAMQSPGWRLLGAFTKDRIARSLAAGDAETVRRLVAPLLAKATAGSQ